jgi:hypothetical protein
MLIGSELREMPEDSAYLVPPTGITEHSNLNLSKERVEWWLYLARGAGPQGSGNNPTTEIFPGGTNVNANSRRVSGARLPGIRTFRMRPVPQP